MEDFQYIGGLQNKKQEAYPSYAKAIKHLNLRFNSLSEAYNSDMEINTFVDDKLLKEDITGFSQYQGNGFSNEGNMEHNTPMFEEETAEDGEIEGISEAEEEDVAMTDEENAIDEMLEFDNQHKTGMGEEPQKPSLGTATNFDEWITALDDASVKQILHSIYSEIGAPVVNIAKRAIGSIGVSENEIDELDEIVESLTESKKKVKTQE
jgi:hypothetical protein